jgi:hypothetical protein
MQKKPMTPEEEVFAAGLLVLCLCIIGMTVAIRKGASNPASEQAVVDFVSRQALPELLVDAVLRCPQLPERALLDAVVTFETTPGGITITSVAPRAVDNGLPQDVGDCLARALENQRFSGRLDGGHFVPGESFELDLEIPLPRPRLGY